MSDERDRLEALTEEVLPALIARLRASHLGELEVATDGWRVRLRRDLRPRPGAATSAASGTGDELGGGGPVGSAARSPGVGYFSPVAELAVGGQVRSGDLLGQVDVLGISHDVNAPTDGLISRVLAESGQVVEYGQVLAEIDPLEAYLELRPDGAAAIASERASD